MLQVGDTVQGVIQKLIFSGKGLLRQDNWVILVDDVLTGEEVIVELKEQRKNFFLADLKSILVPSESRIQPPCPVYGICGGCALQHMRYEQGLLEKALWLQESFERIGKIHLKERPTVLPANPIYGYRRKIKLHFHKQNEKIILGFFAKDNKTVLDLHYCPIFIEKQTELFEHVRSFIKQKNIEAGEVTLCKLDDGSILLELEGNFHVFGSADVKNLSMQVDDLTLFFTMDSFLQNHPQVSLNLYHDVVQNIQNLGLKDPIFDLYSGIGILSHLLAKQGHDVFAVEGNPSAVESAKKSSAMNGIHNITFYTSSVEKFLHEVKKHAPIWIVNPPRTGLSQKVIDSIKKRKPEHLIYISCNPTTLARDVALLAGYEIAAIQGYDMFPQTTHFETVVMLTFK